MEDGNTMRDRARQIAVANETVYLIPGIDFLTHLFETRAHHADNGTRLAWKVDYYQRS
jgi:hypothetical protein